MQKKEIRRKVEEKLNVPRKATEGDENREIEKNLGCFLVEKGYIKGLEKREEDWGFVYYSVTRKIAVSQKEMPHEKWEKCIFKMGFNEKTGENLFPSPGLETEKYRFLHEANHAYQDYLCSLECADNPQEWYERSLAGEIKSPYGELFNFCFYKRMERYENEGEKERKEKGISVWGNAPNYNFEEGAGILNKPSEIAVRAQEDANELVTMYLWHPEYFNIYLDYLSLNHDNYQIREKELTQNDLEREGLVRISKEEKDYLKEAVFSYVEEMKKNIAEY
jgi:hypothetical protein